MSKNENDLKYETIYEMNEEVKKENEKTEEEENSELNKEKKNVKDLMTNIQKYDTESWTVNFNII